MSSSPERYLATAFGVGGSTLAITGALQYFAHRDAFAKAGLNQELQNHLDQDMSMDTFLAGIGMVAVVLSFFFAKRSV